MNLSYIGELPIAGSKVKEEFEYSQQDSLAQNFQLSNWFSEMRKYLFKLFINIFVHLSNFLNVEIQNCLSNRIVIQMFSNRNSML